MTVSTAYAFKRFSYELIGQTTVTMETVEAGEYSTVLEGDDVIRVKQGDLVGIWGKNNYKLGIQYTECDTALFPEGQSVRI